LYPPLRTYRYAPYSSVHSFMCCEPTAVCSFHTTATPSATASFTLTSLRWQRGTPLGRMRYQHGAASHESRHIRLCIARTARVACTIAQDGPCTALLSALLCASPPPRSAGAAHCRHRLSGCGCGSRSTRSSCAPAHTITAVAAHTLRAHGSTSRMENRSSSASYVSFDVPHRGRFSVPEPSSCACVCHYACV